MGKRGFTLVEMAVVLVVVGLLVGGLLAAQSMISTANSHKIVRKLETYNFAIANFRQVYHFYPGDFPNSDTAFSLANSNGNGNKMWAQEGNSAGDTEWYKAWWHLAASGFMKELERPSSGLNDKATAKLWLGRNIPEIVPGVTGQFLYNNSLSGCTTGMNMVVGAWDEGQIDENNFPGMFYLNGALTGPEAQMLDSKMDDAQATTGIVTGLTGTRFNSTSPAYSVGDQCDSAYPSNNIPSCMVRICVSQTPLQMGI
jgi:prepilin-type N-terminal cleavage/methylation domain-containing protein